MVVAITIWQMNILQLPSLTASTYNGFNQGIRPLIATRTLQDNVASSTVVFTNNIGLPAYIASANVENLGGGDFFVNDTMCELWIKIVGEEDWTQISKARQDCGTEPRPPPGTSLISVLAQSIVKQPHQTTIPRWEHLIDNVRGESWGTELRCTCSPVCGTDRRSEICGRCGSISNICCQPCCHPPCEPDCRPERVYYGRALRVDHGKTFVLYAADTCRFSVNHTSKQIELGIQLSYFTHLGDPEELIIKKTSGVVKGQFEII